MEKKQNVPVLRFQGFSSEWNMKYFRDLVVLERGGSPRPIDHYITTDDNGLNWVKIGDAPANGNYITHTAEKIKPEGLSKTRQVFPGDLILSNSMSFGKPYIMGISGCIHDGWLLIRDDKHHFDLKYLCVLLGIPAMLRQYKALAAGSTVSNLNKELVGSTQIHMPDMGEQKEIGSFFEKLDQSIHWCKNKIQKLKQFRQAMLTKLFPREGTAEPELRFRGFLGIWQKRKVKEILVERNEQAPKSKEYPLKAFIAHEGIVDKGKRYDRSALITDTETKLYKRTQYGDFIYSSNNLETGSIGLNKYGNASISPVYSIFYPTNLGVSDFIGYCLVRKEFIQEMVKWRQGVIYGQWRIPESNFLNIDILVPTIDEQREIGKFFRELDTYISLQQKKLERMQRLKAALLEKMFV